MWVFFPVAPTGGLSGRSRPLRGFRAGMPRRADRFQSERVVAAIISFTSM